MTYAGLVGQAVYLQDGEYVGRIACTKRGHAVVTQDGTIASARRPYVAGSDTSHDAAMELAYLGEKERQVYLAFCRYPDGLTDEECQRATSLHPGTQRARRVYLCAEGLLRDSGRRRVTTSGRNATVWAVSRGYFQKI